MWGEPIGCLATVASHSTNGSLSTLPGCVPAVYHICVEIPAPTLRPRCLRVVSVGAAAWRVRVARLTRCVGVWLR